MAPLILLTPAKEKEEEKEKGVSFAIFCGFTRSAETDRQMQVLPINISSGDISDLTFPQLLIDKSVRNGLNYISPARGTSAIEEWPSRIYMH